MRTAAPGGATDALDFLKAQHREVEKLFKQCERAENDDEVFELAQLLCEKLTVHATIEEEIIYPAARAKGEEAGEAGDDASELKDAVLEALEEHLSVKRIIADLQAADAGDERLEAKLSVLKEQVSHHVDEEEDELFPKLKKEFSKDDRRSLGQRLSDRTEELEAAASPAAGRPRTKGAESNENSSDPRGVLVNEELSPVARGEGTKERGGDDADGRSRRAAPAHGH